MKVQRVDSASCHGLFVIDMLVRLEKRVWLNVPGTPDDWRSGSSPYAALYRVRRFGSGNVGSGRKLGWFGRKRLRMIVVAMNMGVPLFGE